MKKILRQKWVRLLVWAVVGALFAMAVAAFCLWAFLLEPAPPSIQAAFYKVSAGFGAVYGLAIGGFMVPAYERILTSKERSGDESA